MEGVVALVALVAAGIAWSRSRGQAALAERIALLEQQLSILRAELAARGGRRPEGTPTDSPDRLATAAPPIDAPAPATQPTEAGVTPPSVLPLPPTPSPAPPPSLVARPTPSTAPAPVAAEPGGGGIDWESWLGVRGAAVLGGIVLSLAGVFFFRYSIEHGLLPPWLRVVLGAVVGTGCLAGSEARLRRAYPGTANALAGAGVVILYAAFFAAHVLYGLVGAGPAFAAMAAVTVACCAVSWRHASLVVAGIGLVGGFATPLLLSSGADRPIGLFGYLLLLDLGMIVLARRRGWPVLAAVALVATTAYEVLWVGVRMGPERLPLGLVILALFAAVFAASARRVAPEGRRDWLLAQAGGVLLPFAFALYFALRADFGAHLWPVALLLAFVGAAAGFVARTQDAPAIALGAAAGSAGVFAAWLGSHALDGRLAYETAGLAVLLAAVPAAGVELASDEEQERRLAPAALVGVIGLFLLLVAAPDRQPLVSLWPWLAGWLGLAALLARLGRAPERVGLHAVAGAGVGLGLARFLLLRALRDGAPGVPESVAVCVAVGVAFQGMALARREPAAAWMERGAGLAVALPLAALSQRAVLLLLPPLVFHAAALALGVLLLLVATRLCDGAWALATTCLLSFVLSAFGLGPPGGDPGEASRALVLQAGAAALLTAWPFLAGRRLLVERAAVWASALAGPALFPSLRALYETRFGDGTIGLLPVALAALALGAAAEARRRLRDDDTARGRALVWHLAVALGFATVAIPLQLEKEWITLGWALEGAALAWLWRRLDHPGLKWAGAALLAAVSVRLVANPALLSYHVGSGWPILNWLLYTYLVPAACLFTASALYAPDEVVRARPFEAPLYAAGRPLLSIGAGIAGLVVVFAWIDLAIVDAFAVGRELTLSLERAPARDLTMSLAWAVYAVVLLALGVRRQSRGLRWASLVLLLVTAVKVFLYDLGELRDLYRVGSLLGLAVSLIGVSLAYQRFVLRDARSDAP
ncbi:MAG TPA: DUF2339 domain-containing protein [Myxococcota bacterium]|jgi:uncharacterized membrane protein|nr:DUF2339 domain-containing protein [Myxococcota bacterium]